MKKFFIFFIVTIFGLVVFFWQEIYLSKDLVGEEKLFLIEKGQGLFEIGENLEKEGLIKSQYLFDFYVLAKGAQRKLQAGEYKLSPSIGIFEIAKKIISGDTAKITLTIPEGFTLKQIEERLNEIFNSQFSISTFQIGDIKENFDFLKDIPNQAGLEGFLFPDTYQFDYGISEEEIIEKMVSNFNRKLTPDLKEEIARRNKTIFEIVTLASLIEKEVKTKEDKELVSGILWKRLRSGIPLEVDATITYLTGRKTTAILKEELQIDSRYNTYKYKGLPPGPISNPGLESIEAAIYPKETDYWFYLSTPEGTTIFSKTLKEHNIAKAKYLK